jgi:hypothetical protein
MTKDLRYPLKQRPFPQRTLVLAVPRRVGLVVGLGLRSKFSNWTWTWTWTSRPNSDWTWTWTWTSKSNSECDLDFWARKPDFGEVRGRGIGLWFWTWTSCASLGGGSRGGATGGAALAFPRWPGGRAGRFYPRGSLRDKGLDRRNPHVSEDTGIADLPI